MEERNLIRKVMEQYKINDEKIAREIALQIKVSEEARGLIGYYEELRRAFGSDYTDSKRVRDYRRRVYKT